MSYGTFPDKPTLHVGDLADPAQMNAAFNGIQAELEDRGAAGHLDGVLAGMAFTINGAMVAIASGQSYVGGLLFTGGASVGFTAGDTAGTYYVYIDPANLAAPYVKNTTAPGLGKLALCSVSWNGSALSGLVDMTPKGIVGAALRFSVVGNIAPGAAAYTVLDRDLWIDDVRVVVAASGSSGATTVDVHVGNAGAEPASIFTDQTRRPSVASGAAVYTVGISGMPDTNRSASAGQVLRVDVDAAATGASGLAVVVRGRYR
jgi:hypothetical protein